jgi:O-acetyl-ADP-ribose deacetylase (regulator of RNase III)
LPLGLPLDGRRRLDGDTRWGSFTSGREAMGIEPWLGDITTLAVDAIVNAANSSLQGGGGVDGAIHRAAGPGLLQECRRLGGCAPGDARLTAGHRLPARWVVHTVGPVWRGGDHGEDAALASCYRRSLEVAGGAGARSIAFPAISTGAFGFPRLRAAEIAVREVSEADPAVWERIVLTAFDRRTFTWYQRLLSSGPAIR